MKSCEYLTAHQRMYISLYIPFLRDTGLYPYPTKHPDSKLAFTMVQKKIDLPLFFGEQEYRFNHRNTEKQMIDKVSKYIFKSHPMTRRQIANALNAAFPIFACR